MPNFLNLNVPMRYDFIFTYLAIMFFIDRILAKVRITRVSNVFRRVWESRNRRILHKRSWPEQKANKG